MRGPVEVGADGGDDRDLVAVGVRRQRRLRGAGRTGAVVVGTGHRLQGQAVRQDVGHGPTGELVRGTVVVRGQRVGDVLTRNERTGGVERLGQGEVVLHQARVDRRVVGLGGLGQVGTRLRRGHVSLAGRDVRVGIGHRCTERLPRERGAVRLHELHRVRRPRQQIAERVVPVAIRRRGLAGRLAVLEQVDRDTRNRSLTLILLTVAVHVPPDVVTDRDQVDLEVGLGVVVGLGLGRVRRAVRNDERVGLGDIAVLRRHVGHVVRGPVEVLADGGDDRDLVAVGTGRQRRLRGAGRTGAVVVRTGHRLQGQIVRQDVSHRPTRQRGHRAIVVRRQRVGDVLTRNERTGRVERLGQGEVVLHQAAVERRIVRHVGAGGVGAGGGRGESDLAVGRIHVRVRLVRRRVVRRVVRGVLRGPGRTVGGRELQDVVLAGDEVVEPVVALSVRRGGTTRRGAGGVQEVDLHARNRELVGALQAVTVGVPPDVVTDRDRGVVEPEVQRRVLLAVRGHRHRGGRAGGGVNRGVPALVSQGRRQAGQCGRGGGRIDRHRVGVADREQREQVVAVVVGRDRAHRVAEHVGHRVAGLVLDRQHDALDAGLAGILDAVVVGVLPDVVAHADLRDRLD